MSILESLKSRKEKDGVDATIKFLLSPTLSPSEKKEYTEAHVFNRDGYLSLSLIYSL